ncbi:DUF2637 domain-containing protein [Nonomuraea ceibae]|uniref:DUF2637 domain-containing protein n=1 Tax=Nonomuraea ceibae TaxID=1935170 RepID=UPI001C5DD12E|nr:DUF2637 domain-containing protein [Nonomuraea ceibae]
MDVTPPSTLRRLGIALAGLAVAALTGAACALSFDDLRALAVRGEARPDLAYLYPAGFAALLVVALIGVLLLRSARTLVRVQAAVVLVLLLVAAAAADAAVALRVEFQVAPTAVGVAIAPWVMLAVALWLWLLLIKHVQDRRTSGADERPDEDDIVPFHRAPENAPEITPETAPAAPRQAAAPAAEEPRGRLEPTPVVGPTPAPETPPISERVTHWQAQEPKAEEPKAEEPEAQEPEVRRPVEAAPPEILQPQEEEPRRPVRWGDRVKPTDVLVHPKATGKDADTQPVPVVADVPDPAHGPEAADPQSKDDERDERDALEDTAPHPVVTEVQAQAPSGRLRSTPLPPEE